MFELLLTVCIGAARCEYLAPPLHYTSDRSCRYQAALLAGRSAGALPSGNEVVYRFRCRDLGSDPAAATWIEVSLAAER